MAQEIDKIIKSTTPPKSKDVLWDNSKELLINRNGKWESTGGGAPMINITYANLVKLRNNSKLIAGMQYRITDYVTTTAQENTRSAGHQFDIIVTADSNNTLNEVARACCSDFDIEKYKDTYSQTWGERMTYLGTYEYYGKIYHRYESESHDMQMLVDFREEVEKLVGAEHYLYRIIPSYINVENNGWESEINDDIVFTHNPAEASYFNGSNLAAWQIWYCLDNDAERFAWARIPLYSPETNSKMIRVKDSNNLTYIYVRATGYDENGKCGWLYAVKGDDKSFIEYVKEGYETVDGEDCIYTNSENLTIGDVLDMGGDNVTLIDMSYIEGKGVIYRMIDEWNNDCPYDFKNIQFKRNLNFDNGYAQFSEDGEETWVYTFAGQSHHINNDEWSGMLDGSLESPFGHMSDEGTSIFHDNTIKPYIVLFNNNEIRTKCGLRYLNDIVFLGYWEKIGSANDEDMPYYYAHCCYCNSFENDCHSNSFGSNCYYNSFGSNCRGNSFGNDCSYNNFEVCCFNNSFMNSCRGNIFGYSCFNNIFGDSCSHNSFRKDCSHNSFRENCNYNSLEDGCVNNSLGADCYYNSFGNGCCGNSFVDNDGIADRVSNNQLDDTVRYVTLYYDESKGNYSGDLKNHHICRGVKNRTVEIYAGRDYETFYAINSTGEMVEFVLADLKNS